MSEPVSAPVQEARRVGLGGVGGGIVSRDSVRSFSAPRAEVSAVSAGVPLYKRAQEMEQLSRTEADRKKNATTINAIEKELSDPRFVAGFGSSAERNSSPI